MQRQPGTIRGHRDRAHGKKTPDGDSEQSCSTVNSLHRTTKRSKPGATAAVFVVVAATGGARNGKMAAPLKKGTKRTKTTKRTKIELRQPLRFTIAPASTFS
jgi:hypothetical protein